MIIKALIVCMGWNNKTSSYTWSWFSDHVWTNYNLLLIGFIYLSTVFIFVKRPNRKWKALHCEGLQWRRKLCAVIKGSVHSMQLFSGFRMHQVDEAVASSANPAPFTCGSLFERVSDWLWFGLFPVQRKWIDDNQSSAILSAGLLCYGTMPFVWHSQVMIMLNVHISAH